MVDNNLKSLRDELTESESRLTLVENERDELRKRISLLKSQIAAEQPPSRSLQPNRSMSAPVASAEKVELFMSLFRGRADIFPKRWENQKNKRKGYSPACSNEWVKGLCKKPKVKCGECKAQAFIPVTAKSIIAHLQGRYVAGVYPMLPDETCWFLAVDFDKGEWRQDVAAFVQTCKSRDVPFAVERSRSGDGAHVWFFFESAVPATIARKMGCLLITETMSNHHALPMSSYDRLFPNQDTMPRGGFGNLIALPFQNEPRRQGNSVFVDESWEPFQDQWGFLASIERISEPRIL